MSFILDALRKAERVRGRVPTLATVHAPARQTARVIGLGAAAGVLLAGAGLLVWFFWPAPNGVPPAATDIRARVSAPTPPSRPSPERKIASETPEHVPPRTFGARVPHSPEAGQEREAPRHPNRAPLASPRSLQASPPQTSVLPAKPTALQDAMAKMMLDVFVYTNVKADRLVVINGRRYVEGQYVDGLYLLEEITPQGAVLSYQGERALLRP
jgi:general secretion pathway protein B